MYTARESLNSSSKGKWKLRGRGNLKHTQHILADDSILKFSVPHDTLPGADFKRQMKSLVIIFRNIWAKMDHKANETKIKIVYILQKSLILSFCFIDITFRCPIYHSDD